MVHAYHGSCHVAASDLTDGWTSSGMAQLQCQTVRHDAACQEAVLQRPRLNCVLTAGTHGSGTQEAETGEAPFLPPP